MQYLDLVLLDPDVVAAVEDVDAAVLGTEPHGRLVRVLVDGTAFEARGVTADRSTRRVRAWNVVRVRVVGTRAARFYTVLKYVLFLNDDTVSR